MESKPEPQHHAEPPEPHRNIYGSRLKIMLLRNTVYNATCCYKLIQSLENRSACQDIGHPCQNKLPRSVPDEVHAVHPPGLAHAKHLQKRGSNKSSGLVSSEQLSQRQKKKKQDEEQQNFKLV
jgi:hypothetical protein